MKVDHPDNSRLFESVLIEDAKERAGDHPSLGTLIEYLHDELAAEAEEQVRDHLAVCRPCTAALLDLEPLVRPSEPQGAVADLQLETAWRDFRNRLGSEDGSKETVSARWPRALAAALLLAAVGLSLWVTHLRRATAELRQEVAELEAPQVNPPVVYLDAITRTDPAELVAELAADQPFLLLIVVPGASEIFPSYEALVTGADGRQLWSGTGLELSPEGTLRLRLPRRMLPAGSYRVRVTGLAEESSNESNRIVVESPLRVLER